MRDGTVYCHARPNPDSRNHEADLVDHRVTEYTTEVILQDGIEDREECHRRTDVDQYIGTNETPCQRVDGYLRCECTQKNRSGGRALRISFCDPIMEQRKTGFDTKGEQ